MKICSKCGEEKELTEFFKAAKQKDGLQTACKSCMNVAYANSRSKKKDHYNALGVKRRAELTERIRAWKEERGCKLCHESFGPCLELHHLNADEKDLEPANCRSWASFIKEAEKCVVLCANCHRKVHHGVIVIS